MNRYNYVNSKEYKNFIQNENIEKELYTNIFYGFYESIFSNSDQFIDMEIQDQNDLINEYPFLNENDFYISYEYENFREYQIDICTEFSKLYIDLIIELLPYDITENPNFLLELKENTLYSPKYYNFDRDHISIMINTNYNTLNKIKNYVLSLNDMENYIYEKNKSYDGFISFLSNNYNYWINTDIKNYECNELSFLFDSLIIKNDKVFDLNVTILDNVEPYEYVNPFVNINYKEILLYDFENYIKNYLKTLSLIHKVMI